MSVRIPTTNTRILKLNQKEYDLILFIREKMPYGKCVLVAYDGQPIRVENIMHSKFFGKKEERTTTQEEQVGE